MDIVQKNKVLNLHQYILFMNIYTKTGDDGTTGLQGGKRVSKSNKRIKSYGAVDEINAKIGIIISQNIDDDFKKHLLKIQNDLFVLGSDLSNPDLSDKKNRISVDMITNLEKIIDHFEKELPEITNFILPGGHSFAALLHEARTITRRAETQLISLEESEKINIECKKYLNRLSDLFFVLARAINKRKGVNDVIWKP